MHSTQVSAELTVPIYASASHTTPPPGHGMVMVPPHPPLWACGGCGWVGFPRRRVGPVVVVDGSFGYVTYDL